MSIFSPLTYEQGFKLLLQRAIIKTLALNCLNILTFENKFLDISKNMFSNVILSHDFRSVAE